MLVGSSPIPVQLYSPLPTGSPGQQDVFHQQGLDMYQTEKGLHLEILDSIQSLTEPRPSQFHIGLLSPLGCRGPTGRLEDLWSSSGTPVAQKA